MAELVIKIDDQTYNHFIRNEYSRADVIAIHAALVYAATPHETVTDHLLTEQMTKAEIKALGQEPKTGHWIYKKTAISFKVKCSECGYTPYFSDREPLYNYCPNCGCRMFESQGSDDKE